MNVNLHCYAPPSAAASLSLPDAAVLQVIRDARGFFRTRGLSVSEIRLRLTFLPMSTFIAVFGRRVPAPVVIGSALARLSNLDLVRRAAGGKWKEASRG